MSFEQPNWLPGEPPPQPNVSPSAAPVPKVLAGTGGAGFGFAVAIVLPWLANVAFGTEMPIEVALAFGALLGTVGSFLAGYFTPPRSM